MNKKLRIGIAGAGVVGGSVIEILEKHKERISQIAGKDIEINAIAEKKSYKNIDITKYRFFENLQTMATDKDIDIIVELIGGTKDFLMDFICTALKSGKHVITANKAIIAERGMNIILAAENNSRQFRYEAAVLGTVPVILPLVNSALPLEPIEVSGIFNGTCNYILTEMQKTKRDFDEILVEAQQKGYAEAEPTLDIQGYDAAHKLTILASIIFGIKLDFDLVHIEGITKIKPIDIQAAEKCDSVIKLLARAKLQHGKILCMVTPVMIPKNSPIALVNGTINAVQIVDAISGPVFLSGHGAGGRQTANAVISDIITIAQGTRANVLGHEPKELKTLPAYNIKELVSTYYVRFTSDKDIDTKKISHLFAENNIKIQKILNFPATSNQPFNSVAFVCALIKKDTLQKTVAKITEEIKMTEPALTMIMQKSDT